jgi:hypothetical protein
LGQGPREALCGWLRRALREAPRERGPACGVAHGATLRGAVGAAGGAGGLPQGCGGTAVAHGRLVRCVAALWPPPAARRLRRLLVPSGAITCGRTAAR